LNYDQLLLEYASTTSNPWIHISVNIKQRRNQVMTFNNHAKYSSGLTQLA
jgi:TATA-binding protein-associated factor Taf7